LGLKIWGRISSVIEELALRQSDFMKDSCPPNVRMEINFDHFVLVAKWFMPEPRSTLGIM
jgi:hypothetical protein